MAICALALSSSLASAAPASAYNFKRSLSAGDSGPAVRALQVRIAGWYPNEEHKAFYLDGQYDRMTKVAVANYQKHNGLSPTGVANESVFVALNRLQDP
ncbi:MAG: peptidoglycan-binding domain-containing protein, partial [Actinomycetota bacterium]